MSVSIVAPVPKVRKQSAKVVRRRFLTADSKARQAAADDNAVELLAKFEKTTDIRRQLLDAFDSEAPFTSDPLRIDGITLVGEQTDRAGFDGYLQECRTIAHHYRAAACLRDDLTPKARKERLASVMDSAATAAGIIADEAKSARGVAAKMARYSVLAREWRIVSENWQVAYFFRDLLVSVVKWSDDNGDWRLMIDGKPATDEHQAIVAACLAESLRIGKNRAEQKTLFADYLRANGILKSKSEKDDDENAGPTMENIVTLARSFVANNPGCAKVKLLEALSAAVAETLAADELTDDVPADETDDVPAKVVA